MYCIHYGLLVACWCKLTFSIPQRYYCCGWWNMTEWHLYLFVEDGAFPPKKENGYTHKAQAQMVFTFVWLFRSLLSHVPVQVTHHHTKVITWNIWTLTWWIVLNRIPSPSPCHSTSNFTPHSHRAALFRLSGSSTGDHVAGVYTKSD